MPKQKQAMMKKRTWVYLLLIIACAIVYYGYITAQNLANDNVSPKFTVDEAVLTISVNDGEEVLLSGISASDDRDGDVSGDIIVEGISLVDNSGKAKVNYAVFDKAGNAARCEREVMYSDYVSPKFKLSTSLTFAQNSNFDILNIIKVTDLFDGDISHHIRATTLDEASVSSVGIHNVEFKVTNTLGDTVELVLPIEIYAAGTYNASVSLTDYLVYLPKGSEFNKNDYLKEFIIGTERTDISGYMPSGYSLRTSGQVDTEVPGVYSVSYYVTYQRNTGTPGVSGASYSGFAKLIVVVEE